MMGDCGSQGLAVLAMQAIGFEEGEGGGDRTEGAEAKVREGRGVVWMVGPSMSMAWGDILGETVVDLL